MDLTWPSNVSNPESWTYYQVQIPVMAYMDDTIFIDSSKKQIQSTINLATEFYDLNDIFINGNKCDLVVINSQLPTVDRTITIGQQKTKILATLNEIRYLGIWIANKHRKRLWITRLEAIIRSFIDIVHRKKLGIGHVAYLINRVLNPKLVYTAQLMTLNESEWDNLFRPVLKMAKQLLSLPSSFPTAAMFHEGIGGLEHPWFAICKKQISDLNL